MTPIRQIVEQAEYTASVHNRSQLPPDEGIEVAIAGRSNSGKSSLINRLCRRKALARTSRTPGRTQQLVFFRLDADLGIAVAGQVDQAAAMPRSASTCASTGRA